MRGDFSRYGYSPLSGATGLNYQQGRLTLDSDSNLLQAIQLHQLRTLAEHLIGPFGGVHDSFQIKVLPGLHCELLGRQAEGIEAHRVHHVIMSAVTTAGTGSRSPGAARTITSGNPGWRSSRNPSRTPTSPISNYGSAMSTRSSLTASARWRSGGPPP